MRTNGVLRVFLCACFLASCAGPQKQAPPRGEELSRAMAQPLAFKVPFEAAPGAWRRAHDWVTRFSKMPLKKSTDHLIETDPPSGSFTAYSVTRTVASGVSEITVRAFGADSEKADRNAHILAYYIATGDLADLGSIGD